MPTIFSKNCINVGEVESYCLPCSKYLVSEEDGLEHIQRPEHKDKLNACGYLQKLKHDYIRKIKSVYFCELCNVTFPTAAKVGLHVKELTHLDHKSGRLERKGNEVVFVQHNIQVTSDAWNGIVDGTTCVLCNAEFDEDVAHKSEQNHVLNVIRSKVTAGPNNICRKIDGVFQCLTCNVVVSENVLQEHLSSEEHIEKYNTKKINAEENNETGTLKSELQSVSTEKNNNDKVDKVSDENVSTKTEHFTLNQDLEFCRICDWIIDGSIEQHVKSYHHQTLLNMHNERIITEKNNKTNANGRDGKEIDAKSEVLHYVSTHHKTDINIDLIKDIIVCKKCSKYLHFDIKDIERHMLEHDSKVSVDSKPLLSDEKCNKIDGKTLYTKPVLMNNKEKTNNLKELEILAKKHGLSLNKDENKINCKVCSTHITATVQNINEHIAGHKHKKNLTKVSKDEKQPLQKFQKVTLEQFGETIEFVEQGLSRYIIINDTFLIREPNFFGIVRFQNKLICQFCNIDLNPKMLLALHISEPYHREILENCYLVTSHKDEFVRQLKPDLFDCVYCGRVENDWDDMLDHLSTSEHKKCKDEHQQLLARFKEQRLQDRVFENMRHNLFLAFMNNLRQGNLQ